MRKREGEPATFALANFITAHYEGGARMSRRALSPPREMSSFKPGAMS